jgi:hypothetical protein
MMTLADAFHALAVSGCRLVSDPITGMALDVPPGATVDRQVLEVLSANREAVAAALAPPPPAVQPDAGADLADYLASKGIGDHAAELVRHAADTFGIRHSAITIEADELLESPPEFFENGIPFTTNVETKWHEPGRGYITMPAGTPGLAIPQTWAIADDFARNGIERYLESIRKRKLPTHVPIWLDGQARVIEANLITFTDELPADANLQPWRSPAITSEVPSP